MRDASRAAGAELVVMFVPFKSQVFLPIAVEAMPHDELVSALRYSLPDGRIDVAAMTANRLAQNRMMRRFCADSGIRFLDTTDTALAERLREGVNVYFPDDSHSERGRARGCGRHARIGPAVSAHAKIAEFLNAFALGRFP